MDLKSTFETVERYAARVHLLVWIFGVLGSVLSGIWANMAGFSWPLVALTAFGGFVVVLLIVTAAFWLVMWFSEQFPQFRSNIPLHEAARLAYEAAEKAGVIDLTLSPTTPAEGKLTHFKLLFVVDDETELFGVKPPSTRPRLIPKAEIDHLYPSDGDVSELSTSLPLDSPTYVNVTVRRKDLRRVINKYVVEYAAEARRLAR